MYYVYVLECADDSSWYIGYTKDLRTRLKDHQNKRGRRTTAMKNNLNLIYYEAYIEKLDAMGREKFLKGGSGRTYLKKQLKHYFEKNIQL
ncbi:MAG TPA: excinuclease ABC subunit C [Candidatus Moranbacteria bacterium]|nr:MAG: Excinuclease ABC C subunit domain protein [Candidatus Moranbacteria bacterium GW2011_GWF1_34_10]HBI17543.1 excinuclease ABC subunit C [Candidatus Moranbacteria bacterium]